MRNSQKPFSLQIYLLIVVAISWPFQIAYVLWADTPFMRYALSSLPMMMVAVATYIWTVTQSLAVVTVYHAAFDEIRDAIATSIGFGSLVEIWQTLTLTVLGGFLLWKGNWKQLTARQT
jgi:hypothetical protein